MLSRRCGAEKDIVFVAGNHEECKWFAHQLINGTLAPLDAEIDTIAVKIDHELAFPLAVTDFHCTIIVKTKGGASIRAEARDCDDILAVYRALAMIVDQVPMIEASVGDYSSGRI